MSYVLKNELTGFRSATKREEGWIAAYMKSELQKEFRPINFWLAVCSIISGSLLLNLLTKGNEQTIAYNIVSFLLFLGTALGIWGIRKVKYGKRQLWRNVEQGNYVVLDCKAYDIQFPVHYISIALVKICTSYGQYCEETFQMERYLGRLCQKEPETALILLKYGDYYKVIKRNSGGEGK